MLWACTKSEHMHGRATEWSREQVCTLAELRISDFLQKSSMRIFHKLYLGELCIQSVVFYVNRFKVTACIYFSIKTYLKHWFAARVKQ